MIRDCCYECGGTGFVKTGDPRDHLIEKDGFYYRPNRCGYTKAVSAAGRYTKAEAEREAAIEPWHMRAVPLASVPALSPVERMINALRAIADGQIDARVIAKKALEEIGLE